MQINFQQLANYSRVLDVFFRFDTFNSMANLADTNITLSNFNVAKWTSFYHYYTTVSIVQYQPSSMLIEVRYKYPTSHYYYTWCHTMLSWRLQLREYLSERLWVRIAFCFSRFHGTNAHAVLSTILSGGPNTGKRGPKPHKPHDNQ